jgi:alkylation response protein AidB-like acyl-CoA dehydrogenase
MAITSVGRPADLRGNGLSREYPIEKLMRDARASMIEDGCNDLLSLVAAESL